VRCRERSQSDERDLWAETDERINLSMILLMAVILWLLFNLVRSNDPVSSYLAALLATGGLGLVLRRFRHRISSGTLHFLSWIVLCVPLFFLLFLKLNHKDESPFAPARTFDEDGAIGLEDGVSFNDGFLFSPQLKVEEYSA